MIDKGQVQEAIACCNGKPEPNRSDAILLAACHILRDHFRDAAKIPDTGHSFVGSLVERAEPYADEPSGDPPVGDYGGSDFLQAVVPYR